MRCLPVIILAIVLAVEGKVDTNVENQQTSTEPLQIAEYISKAQSELNRLGTQIQHQLNLPDQKEFFDSIKEHSTNLANNVQSYVQNMSEEVKAKTPELENLWASMKTKLIDTVNSLSINPETTEQINQMKNTFQESIQTLVTESENAFKSASENSGKMQEQMAKMTKQILDMAKQASENLNNQLQQTTTQHSN